MRRDINFFSIYHSQPNSEGSDRYKIIALSVIAGSIILVLVTFFIIKIFDFVLVSKTQEALDSLQDPQVTRAEQKLKAGTDKIAALQNYKNAANKIVSGVNAVKGPDSSTLSLIASKEPADVTVTGVSYTSGCLTLNCASTDDESPSNFVHALEQSGSFSSVSNSEITKGDNNQYNFNISILLKGGKSK